MTRAGRGRRVAVLAGVAAQAAVLAGCGSAAVPAGDGTATPAGATAVPWKDLPPTYPTIPQRTVPAVPDPAAAQAAPACRARNLRSASELDGAGGSWYLSVHLRSADGHTCRVQGTPTVRLLEGDRPVDVHVEPLADSYWSYPDPVLVAPGRSAVLTLVWATDWCTRPLRTDRVRLGLRPGGGQVTVRGFGHTPGCTERVGELTPAQRHRTPVRVSTFRPQHHRAARVVSPYAGLDAAARRTSPARPGEPFYFTVTLTARHDVALDPCPDYTVRQYLPDHRSREDRYALDCANVPTRDEQGRPYLPAGKPTTFSMRTSLLGDPAGLKFLWTLEVPEQPAAAPRLTGAG